MDILNLNGAGHIYVSLFAISIFENSLSDRFKALGVTDDKLVSGKDTDAYFLLTIVKNTDTFHKIIIPSVENDDIDFLLERFIAAEAFRHMLAHMHGMPPSAHECLQGIRVLQQLLS